MANITGYNTIAWSHIWSHNSAEYTTKYDKHKNIHNLWFLQGTRIAGFTMRKEQGMKVIKIDGKCDEFGATNDRKNHDFFPATRI